MLPCFFAIRQNPGFNLIYSQFPCDCFSGMQVGRAAVGKGSARYVGLFCVYAVKPPRTLDFLCIIYIAIYKNV